MRLVGPGRRPHGLRAVPVARGRGIPYDEFPGEASVAEGAVGIAVKHAGEPRDLLPRWPEAGSCDADCAPIGFKHARVVHAAHADSVPQRAIPYHRRFVGAVGEFQGAREVVCVRRAARRNRQLGPRRAGPERVPKRCATVDCFGQTSVRTTTIPHHTERATATTAHNARLRFAVRLNEKPIGLEAAHIKWHGARGPDVVANALSLCALHHRLFDKGAFTLSPSRQIVVTNQATGAGVNEALGQFHATPITLPANPGDAPDPVFAGWHTREVFVSPGFLII